MMRVHEISAIKHYPECYMADVVRSELEELDLAVCKKVSYSEPVILEFQDDLSTKKVLSYNYYNSYMGDFVSPLLASLLRSCKNIENELQLIDTTVILNGKEYHGFGMLNILRKVPCLDMEKSVKSFRTIFTKVVLKEEIDEQFCIAKVADFGSIKVISGDVKKLLDENNVKGLYLSP